MWGKPLELLNATDVKELVEARKPEGHRLDYKQNHPAEWLNWPKDMQKREENASNKQAEFLRDVAAFANADGGSLVFGVIEDGKGFPRAAVGIEEDNPEKVKQHLGNLCRHHLSPSLVPRIEFIEGFSSGWVVVVDVPASWSKPHMVTRLHGTEFWIRQNTDKAMMDYQTLQRQFARRAGLVQQVRNFHKRRIEILASPDPWENVPPVSMHTGGKPKVALHVVPLPSFANGERMDFEGLNVSKTLLQPLEGLGDSRHYTLDGLARFRNADSSWPRGYVLLFRDGSIESVNCEFEQIDSNFLLSGAKITNAVTQSLACYSEFYRRNGLDGPFAVFMSFVHSRKLTIEVPSGERVSPDRTPLLLPEIVVDDLCDIDNCHMPLFTLFYQSLHERFVSPNLRSHVSSRQDAQVAEIRCELGE